VYEDFVNFLVINYFSEKVAREITDRVLQTCTINHPREVLKAYADAVRKWRKRLAYDKPIYSVVGYFFQLVVEELRPGYLPKKTKEKETPTMPRYEFADMLFDFRNGCPVPKKDKSLNFVRLENTVR
jgi:hypothetical protein